MTQCYIYLICVHLQTSKKVFGTNHSLLEVTVKAWVEQNASILKHVQALEWEEVDLSTTEGNKRFVDLNKAAIDGGYEGVMIKDIDAPMNVNVTHAWLKAKPFIEVSLEVKDVEEGTGRNEGKLGALVCEGIDDGRSIKVNVGSGFTDSDRDSFWNAPVILGILLK